MGSCSCCGGSALLWVTFLLTTFCLFSPFWVEISFLDASKFVYGIFLACEIPETGTTSCDVVDYAGANDSGRGWYVSAAVLWALGNQILWWAAIGTSCLCCCRRGCSIALAVFTGIAGFLFMVSVILFGSNQQEDIDLYPFAQYTFTFYLAIVAVLLVFGIMALFIKSACDQPKQKVHPVPAGAPIQVIVRQM